MEKWGRIFCHKDCPLSRLGQRDALRDRWTFLKTGDALQDKRNVPKV